MKEELERNHSKEEIKAEDKELKDERLVESKAGEGEAEVKQEADDQGPGEESKAREDEAKTEQEADDQEPEEKSKAGEDKSVAEVKTEESKTEQESQVKEGGFNGNHVSESGKAGKESKEGSVDGLEKTKVEETPAMKAEDSESKEALEAATMDLAAEPYRIPRAAFKMPAWAKTSIITAVILLLTYGAGILFFTGRFMWKSSLNGVDISLLTPEQAQNKLETMVTQYELEILERDGKTEVISGSDIHLEIEFLTDVQEVVGQQETFLWFLQIFRQKDYTLASQVTYDIVKLQEEIQSLACMQPENITEPVEPQIERVLGTFTIQEGIEGNKPLAYALGKTIRNAVSTLSPMVDLEKSDCYEVLEYSAEDSVVQDALGTLEQLQELEITYEFPDGEETLTGDDILEWVNVSEDYEIQIDKKQACDFVESMLESFEIRGQIIDFQTSLNQRVEITSYLRSSELDRDEEVKELLAMVEKAGESRQTEFVRKASDMADIGDTYIEINLTSQHLYCYKDGEMILETDIVSGRPSTGHATPPGIFTIRYTASPAILVGEDYRTPVSYWMPFNGGIGLHDATWQYAFGGSRYISHGSHGCINLPLSMAKEIYNNYEAGDVVVVYHLPGSAAGSTVSAERPSSSTEASTTEVPDTAAQEPNADNQPSTEAPPDTSSENPEPDTEQPIDTTEAATEDTTEPQNP